MNNAICEKTGYNLTPSNHASFNSFTSSNHATLNLSDRTLNNLEINLLNKGLTFIPTPKFVYTSDILTNTNKLMRNLKLKAYFHNTPNFYDPKIKKFQYPSTWTPDNSTLSSYVKHTIQTIEQTSIDTMNRFKKFTLPSGRTALKLNQTRNFSSIDRQTIQSLTQDSSIIIKQADKGNSTVIMNRSDYILEATRQLSDTNFYQPLTSPLIQENKSSIHNILLRMLNSSIINQQQFKFLLGPDQPTPRHFYLLPKIHKPPEKWTIPHKIPPGRPIVSDVNSESSNISDYVTSFLTPLANKHPSYIKNSFDLVQKLKDVKIPPNSFLVTADIDNLYTNMKHDRTISTIKQSFLQYPDYKRPDSYLLEILHILLSKNDFEFNNQYYLQTCGCPMGKKIGPAAANIYLLEFDNQAMNYPLKPLLFFRYLDDIFFIWTYSIPDLLDFEKYLNNLIPGIHLTFTYDTNSVNFLDITISKHYFPDYCSLTTTVFFKPTDTHQLLHCNSHHPHHTTSGLLKSQLIRFKRLSHNWTSYSNTCKILFHKLQHRGYSWSKMKRTMSDVWSSHSQSSSSQLQPLLTQSHQRQLHLILPYNKLGTFLNSQFRYVLNNNHLFKQYKIITAYTNHPNLRKFLIRNRIP